jgi:hypothetical protein
MIAVFVENGGLAGGVEKKERENGSWPWKRSFKNKY